MVNKKNHHVRFSNNKEKEDGGGSGDTNIVVVHEIPRIENETERKLYWYSQLELQAILVKAITSAGLAVQEARKNGGEMPSLRGLEPLSKTSKDRKEEIALDRVRVIQSYSKQKRQNNNGGTVDEEKIRKLYLTFTEIDTKRALAYGKIDYKESYCYKPQDDENGGGNNKSKTKKEKKGKGIFGFLFGKKNTK